MASENGSQDNPTKFERRFYVLNAGWRLRMVHRTRSCGCLQREIGAQRRMASENGSLRRETWTVFRSFVLNAGWRLRMVHPAGKLCSDGFLKVLNAGWRLRMVHSSGSGKLPDLLRSAQRRMASENGSRGITSSTHPLWSGCSTPDGV